MSKELDKGWSPYIAGGLAGLLIIGSVWFAGKYLGASTSFVRSVGMIESFFSPDHVKSLEYFTKETPIIEWQWMFVVGIMIGAFLSAIQSRTFKWQAIPDSWESRFGTNRTKRFTVAFIGGAIAMFGARLAGG